MAKETIGPREEATIIIQLNQPSIKLTPNECMSQPASEKLLFAVGSG